MRAAKYVKLPVVIDAIEWTGSNIDDIGKFLGSYPACNFTKKTISIYTLEGDMTANRGDMIIKGAYGEFYPCKSDIFKVTYKLHAD